MAQFLCTADLHIGRQSSGFDGETSLGAFNRIVDLAISENADGVLIAGDLFDSSDAQFYARRQVAAGLERLKAKQISVIAVAGNHDYDAMPTFVHAYPGLIDLFGSSAWEEREVAGLRIVGRSFGAPSSRTLIDQYDRTGDGRLTIGLLHADVDTLSSYNPTPLNSLAGRGVQAWVLGHVHSSRHWPDSVVVYPGSPQALDAGETGIHGVRWLRVDGAKVSVSDVVPLSTVRFESVQLEIQPDETIDDVIGAYLSKQRISEERFSLRVSLKRLSGAAQTATEGAIAFGQHVYEIVDWVDEIEENLDLEKEAEQTDARGQAARLLLGLDGRGDPSWILRADGLAEAVKLEMIANRRKLKLDGREEFDQLMNAGPDESRQAVRRSLESVLAEKAGGAR